MAWEFSSAKTGRYRIKTGLRKPKWMEVARFFYSPSAASRRVKTGAEVFTWCCLILLAP